MYEREGKGIVNLGVASSPEKKVQKGILRLSGPEGGGRDFQGEKVEAVKSKPEK